MFLNIYFFKSAENSKSIKNYPACKDLNALITEEFGHSFKVHEVANKLG